MGKAVARKQIFLNDTADFKLFQFFDARVENFAEITKFVIA